MIHREADEDDDDDTIGHEHPLFQSVKKVLEMAFPYDDDQRRINFEAPSKVKARVLLVLGGPGCAKTSTMIRTALMCMIIGHKLLVLAVQDTAVDKFVRACEDGRKLLVSFMKKEKSRLENGSRDERLAAKHYLLILTLLGKLSTCRFEPVAAEFRNTLNMMFTTEKDKNLMYKNPKWTDEHAFDADTRVLALTVEAHKIGLEIAELMGQAESSQQEANIARSQRIVATQYWLDGIQSQIAQIWQEYNFSELQESVRHPLPPTVKLEYWLRHLYSLKKRPTDLSEARANDAVQELEKANTALDNSSEAELQKRKEEHLMAAQRAIQTCLSMQSMVATIYDNSLHPFLGVFKPTVVGHEEVSQTSYAAAASGLCIRHVKAHIFVGDPCQGVPFVVGKDASEFAEFAEKSIIRGLVEAGFDKWPLNNCYRSSEGSGNFINNYCYEGRLKYPLNTETHQYTIWLREVLRETYLDYNQDVIWGQDAFWINHTGRSQVEQDTSSSINAVEAAIAEKLVDCLIMKGIPQDQLRIICYYRGQLRAMKARTNAANRTVFVNTVDKEQGEECGIYIILTTYAAVPRQQRFKRSANKAFIQDPRNPGSAYSVPAHIRSLPRATVALSRDKYGHIFLGSIASWNQVWSYEEQRPLDWLHDMIKYAAGRHTLILDSTKVTTNIEIVDQDLRLIKQQVNQAVSLARQSRATRKQRRRRYSLTGNQEQQDTTISAALRQEEYIRTWTDQVATGSASDTSIDC